MSYRAAWSSLEQLGNQWKGVLGISEDTDQVAVKQLESAVGVYLRRVCSTHDLSSIVKVQVYLFVVWQQIFKEQKKFMC